MTSKPQLLIGADPEVFLIDKDGKFISAINKIGGNKRFPVDIGKGCAIQEDNVAAEFNIPPAADADAFIASIEYALSHLSEVASKKGLSLSITASKVFDDDQLMHLRARMFGCDTDYNCWTKKPNPRPSARNQRLRTTGGHVHYGCKLDPIQLARWSDVRHGLNSVLEDDDTERRQLYGQAGSFRPKAYGIEYRTLSNYWLRDKTFMKLVYQRCEQVVDDVSKGRELMDDDGVLIQHAINRSDRALAKELLITYI
jgi:hypothetical protein